MCDPVTLFGVGTVSALGPTIPTIGLLGAGGSFGLGAGSLLGAGTFGASAVGASSALSFGSLFKIASSGISLFGQLSGGANMQAQYEYQANVARYNAQVAENNALAAKYSAEHDAALIDDKKKRILSQQRSGFAKSGVVINQDTPLLIEEDTEMAAMQDRLSRIYQGDMEGAAFKASAAGHLAQAQNYRISGQNAISSSRLAAVKTVAKLGESLLA